MSSLAEWVAICACEATPVAERRSHSRCNGAIASSDRRLRGLVVVSLTCVLTLTTTARAQDIAATPSRPRVGLVLSGGSAKGFAHIGVLAALERLGVPVDVVSGTSMGAVLGGLYAIGYTPRELREIAASQDWSALLGDRREREMLVPDRRVVGSRTQISFPVRGGRVTLPSGIVRGDAIMRLLERSTWRAQAVRDFSQLPRPFTAVATDVETGEAVALSTGVLSHAMRASMALTGIIQPIRLDGRLLMDGAVARNLPAQDARALGADVLICSDVSGPLLTEEDLGNVIDIVIQTVAFQMAANNEAQRRLCDVVIQPDVKDLSTFAFEEVDEWITRGETAAALRADTLRQIAAAARLAPPPRSPTAPLLGDSVLVSAIEVSGVTAPHARTVVTRAVDLRMPGHFTARSFDRALSRLSATQLFERATYRIDARATDTVAVIEVEAQPQDQIGLGFRFDDHRKAALLFTGTLYNRMQYGSTLDADIRLGEPTQFGLSYLAGRGLVSSVSLGAEARYTRTLLDVFDDGERTGDVNTRVAEVTGVMARTLTRSSVVGVRAGAEYVDADFRVAATDSALERAYYTGGALLWRDTFDRAVFPTRGIALRLRSEIGAHRLSRKSFSQHVFDIEQILGLTRSTVMRVRAVAGTSSGDDLPVHRVFFLGGAFPSPAFTETQPIFWGLKPQERSGRVVQVLRLSLQAEIRADVYATIGANAGNTFEKWTWSSSDYLAGWAASLGMATPLGPVEVVASGRGLDQWPRLSVSLGPVF